MPDDRLLLSAVMRVGIVLIAVANAGLAARQYRQYRDARGLRGFVAGLTMLFGASALGSSSPVIADAFPALADAFRWATTIAVSGFVVGLVFSTYTWLLPHDGRGDH